MINPYDIATRSIPEDSIVGRAIDAALGIVARMRKRDRRRRNVFFIPSRMTIPYS